MFWSAVVSKQWNLYLGLKSEISSWDLVCLESRTWGLAVGLTIEWRWQIFFLKKKADLVALFALSVTSVLGDEQSLAVHCGTSEPASPTDISPVSHLTAGTVAKFVFLSARPYFPGQAVWGCFGGERFCGKRSCQDPFSWGADLWAALKFYLVLV